MTKFTATEGSSAPIVLGRDPIQKPEIWRGEFELRPSRADIIHEELQAITIIVPCSSGKFVLTYHQMPIRDWYPDGRILAQPTPQTIVTWEPIQ